MSESIFFFFDGLKQMSRKVQRLARFGYLVDSYPVMWDLTRSKGSWLWNASEGCSYLDFHCGYGSNPLGHNHDGLIEAMTRSPMGVSAFWNKPACGDFYTEELLEFVETFQTEMIPRKMQTAPLFFIDGGAAANDNAIKVAQDYKVQRTGNPKATKIAGLTDAFHGRSPGSLSLTNTDPHKTKLFAKFEGWPRIPTTDGTPEADEALLAHLSQAFEEGNDEIAGVMVEPIQCEGGDNHLTARVLQGIQALCRQHDALFMLDEVQTGFWTTGARWCFQHFDLTPDVVTFGKKSQQCGIWGGPKVAAFKDGCMHQSGRISSTWSGNLVDMIRSTHIMRIIKDDGLAGNAIVRGKQFVDVMQIFGEKYPQHISNVRGRGLIIAFDATDTKKRNLILQKLYSEEKFIGLACGDRTVRFRPNVNVYGYDMDIALGRIENVLNKI